MTPGHDEVDNCNNNNNNTLTISASDILRLIQAHLTEAGLHQTVKCLQRESGVAMAGLLQPNLLFHASSGQWAAVLQSLSLLDPTRAHLSQDLLAATHEMAILELAEAGDLQVAYATYRLVQKALGESASEEKGVDGSKMSRARVLEQKLAALASVRAKDPQAAIPRDFYGTSSSSSSSSSTKQSSKQKRREEIGNRLQQAVPQQPMGRLTNLLQQAIKWETYTGQLPRIRQWWEDDEEEDDAKDDAQEKTRKKRRMRREFDLVLGESNVDELSVGDAVNLDKTPAEPIPSALYSTVKFGKNATAESALFLPDGSGLVTGSSDGLIEIWDADQKYKELKMDLPYQAKEELMGHDDENAAVTALAVSKDGTLLGSGSSHGQVKVWRIDTGKCLRVFKAHDDHSAVSCLDFSLDGGSHILTGSHDGTCREFGLRTSRMLKEFRGHHSSYISCCSYQLIGTTSSSSTNTLQRLFVITGSGDGTVRLWDSKTLDVVRVLCPVSLGKSSTMSVAGSSIVVNARSDASSQGSAPAPAIHTVLHLHTPESTMLLVPRGYRAFMVDYSGTVLRIFEDDGVASDKVFVAAAVSSSNQWLFAVKEDGVCCVFRIDTGQLESTIRNFGAETTMRMSNNKDSNSKTTTVVSEISSVLCHPNKSILAAFSNDKRQKRGILQLWK